MIKVRASQIFTHSMEDVVAAKKLLDMLNIGENSRMFKNLSFDYSIIDNPKINEPTPLFPRYEK